MPDAALTLIVSCFTDRKRPRGEHGLFYLMQMKFRGRCFREPDRAKFA
jgi:hypothetical protein